METDLVLDIRVDLREVESAAGAFAAAPVIVKAKLRTAIKNSSVDALRNIKALIRERLRRRTGALLRSWDRIPVKETSDGVDGGVRTSGEGRAYALYQSYGYHGVETVKAHTRRTPSGRSALVKAHSRVVAYSGTDYMPDAIDNTRPNIIQNVRGAIVAALDSIRARIASGRSLTPRDGK